MFDLLVPPMIRHLGYDVNIHHVSLDHVICVYRFGI